MGDKGGRMGYKEYREQIASGAVAAYTPKQFEQKVQSLLTEAVALYGNAPPPDAKTGKQAPPPDAGYWRDIDKADPKNNRRRIPGKLDFEYWRIYPHIAAFPGPLAKALPMWKQLLLIETEQPFSFTLEIEAKTGGGVPNPEQERTIRRVNLNPGSHALVVYPHDLPMLRRMLGL